MRLTKRLRKQADVDIKDYYALNVGTMWRGLRQESWAFWFLCSYLFIEYVRPELIYPVLKILPWAQLALLFSLIAMFSDRSVSWVKSSANPLVILFFLIVFLSCLFAFRPALSWGKFDILINWLLVYFMIITIVNTEKRFYIVILLFILINFKMSLFGFRTFMGRGFAFSSGWGVSGSPGWFGNAADLGIQMVIFIPLLMVFIYTLKQYWGRTKILLFYFIAVTGLLTVVATDNRGTQLGLACVGIWYAMKSRLGLKALLGILIVGVALYQIAPPEMLAKFETAGEDGTSQARLVLWGYGVDVVQDHPLLGIGYENWVDYCWYFNPHRLEKGVSCLVPHNTYVSAAAETGLLGLLFYLLLIITIFRVNMRTRANARTSKNDFIYYMAHGLDAGLVGYMVSSIFVTVLFYPMFWVQLALTVALYEISRKKIQCAV